MKVKSDDDIPKTWKNKIHVPNHLSDIYIYVKQQQYWGTTMQLSNDSSG